MPDIDGSARRLGEIRAKHDIFEAQLRQHTLRLEALEASLVLVKGGGGSIAEGFGGSNGKCYDSLERRLSALEILAMTPPADQRAVDAALGPVPGSRTALRYDDALMWQSSVSTERALQQAAACDLATRQRLERMEREVSRLDRMEREMRQLLDAGALLQGAVEDAKHSCRELTHSCQEVKHSCQEIGVRQGRVDKKQRSLIRALAQNADAELRDALETSVFRDDQSVMSMAPASQGRPGVRWQGGGATPSQSPRRRPLAQEPMYDHSPRRASPTSQRTSAWDDVDGRWASGGRRSP
eukprot:gnl/TRDRNA2_/TRDRNA2_188702_c0_seq1.p1 gnl/TRDRNA2_/TRDRNA2_188702_c0~~gnl/TRDRNA2_/TRDRNA2_188702_c0_seq1.p1  ORF type:complete len:315 (+),score=49.90 gnl/TRDRNA2_/TRDRNA2_188702_c0_seq1:57-947(+)